MSQRLEGTFEVISWEEEPAEGPPEAAKVTRATIGQRWAGGIEADGTVSDMVMAYRGDGTADFVGFQRVVGRIGDRRGSFVLQTIGHFDGKETRGSTLVVAGSANGDLVGLRGTGVATAPSGTSGSFTLDYQLD